MSILIKGVKMPSCCGVCPCNDDSWRCGVLGRFEDLKGYETYWDLSKGRFPDCPLVEIPPHGRLIDADKLCEYARNSTVGIDANDICRFPCVIEAEEKEHE